MRTKINISIIIVFSFCLQLTAQGDLPKKAIGKPKMFDHPTEQEYNLSFFDKASEWWRVFSDRESNPVYDKPNGNVIQYLSFMQNFVVAEYKKGWLHLAKVESSQWPYFDKSAQDIGWVKADNMLLWDKSLEKDLTSQIARKAMIVVSEANIEAGSNNQKNIFYNDPLLKTKGHSKPAIFEIFYVFKIDPLNQSVLLGNGTRLSGESGAIRKTVPGWLPFSKVSFWDHRQCLEPNPATAAINERKQKAVEAAIFREQAHSYDYINSINDTTIEDIWTSNYSKRMPGNHIRFPIFEFEGDVFNVGYIGKWGKDCPCNDEKLNQKKDSIIDKKEKLHFIFVIDGTKSMKNYYDPIPGAIGDLITKMKCSFSFLSIMLSFLLFSFSSLHGQSLPHFPI
ncbi:MAG: type VI secretion system protein TssR [Bacteroidota bacterium]|nr:type VI secretion system protein TssR [Bacteroidota bacterium]